jgi:predicted Zn-ribbon and HTH transcriptional regulator
MAPARARKSTRGFAEKSCTGLSAVSSSSLAFGPVTRSFVSTLRITVSACKANDNNKERGVSTYNKERARAYYIANRERLLEKGRLYRQSNPDKVRAIVRASKIKHKDRRATARKIARASHPAREMYTAAKARAKKYGYEFSIKVEDVVVPTHCPVLGVKLELGDGTVSGASPSLDRIDNSRGYTPDNVQVISTKANVMKNSANVADLLRFAYWCTTTFGYRGTAV